MTFLQSVIDGIGLGAVYALVGVGLGLVFGVMRLVNFAYGELITAGGYTLWVFSNAPAAVAILACIAVVVVLALLQERIAFRPLRGASPATMLITTFAVSFLLQNVYLLIFGSRGKSVSTLGSLNDPIVAGSLTIRWITVVAAIVAVVLLVALTLLLNRTMIGLQLRAAAADLRTARTLGVRADRVIMVAFGASGVLAAVSAVLLTVSSPLVTPDFGVQVTIFGLVGVVVGGLDRLWTAALGGFMIGFANNFVGDLLPSASAQYLPSVVYGLVIVVLLLRPSGVFAPPRATAAERV
jgi:branched-chain amino acid transport system permease protein